MGGTGGTDHRWRSISIGEARSLCGLRALGVFDDSDFVEEQASWYGIGEEDECWILRELNLSELDGQFEDLGFEDEHLDRVRMMMNAYLANVSPPPIIAIEIIRMPPSPPSFEAVDGSHRLAAARQAQQRRISAWIASVVEGQLDEVLASA